MRKIIFSFLFLSSGLLLQAQDTSAYLFLKKYYSIKEALVAGDAKQAAAEASDFAKKIVNVNARVIDAEYNNKLRTEAAAIAGTADLEKQRDAFSPFSEDMFQLSKKISLSSMPIYRQYCPMKKMYWLSAETAIRNPYYGSMMLSCGKVVETIKPK